MRVTQRMMTEQLRRNINASGESLIELQDQLSSGKRLRKPSDDPQALNRAMTLKSGLDETTQHLRNAQSARGWYGAATVALAQLSNVLTRARDQAERGATGSLGDEERRALGKQIDSLLEEAIRSTSSKHEGYYIFSGKMVHTAPFTPTRDPVTGQITGFPATPYAGDAGSMLREIGPGVELAVNLPGNTSVDGQQPLMRSLTSLLAIRKQLNGEAPLAGSTPVTGQQLDELTATIDGISSLQSELGARMNRLDATEDALTKTHVSFTAMLSRVQDADAAEVMTRLMTQETVYKAALAMGARSIQPSLLDFLR